MKLNADETTWLQLRFQEIKKLKEQLSNDTNNAEIRLSAKNFSKLDHSIDLVHRLQEIYGKVFWQ